MVSVSMVYIKCPDDVLEDDLRVPQSGCAYRAPLVLLDEQLTMRVQKQGNTQ